MSIIFSIMILVIPIQTRNNIAQTNSIFYPSNLLNNFSIENDQNYYQNKIILLSLDSGFSERSFSKVEKPNKWYLVFRVIFVVSSIVALICPYVHFFVLIWKKKKITISELSRIPKSLIFPMIISIILVGGIFLPDLMLFPFQYSLVGKYKRTPPPVEKTILKYHQNICRISRAGKGASLSCNWKLYPSGLSISLLIDGKIFIPFQDMIDVKKSLENFNSDYYILNFNNPEFRSHSIILPNAEIARVLKNKIRVQNNKKQIST
jgi:hypothetical protein